MSLDRGLRLNPAKFFMYPCRGVLHTPRNNPHRRFGGKTGQVFGRIFIGKGKIGCVFDVFECGIVKLDGFFTYPCRGVLHTTRKTPRRRFAPKTGRVFGVSLLGKVKSGAFLVGTRFGRRGEAGVLTPSMATGKTLLKSDLSLPPLIKHGKNNELQFIEREKRHHFWRPQRFIYRLESGRTGCRGRRTNRADKYTDRNTDGRSPGAGGASPSADDPRRRDERGGP